MLRDCARGAKVWSKAPKLEDIPDAKWERFFELVSYFTTSCSDNHSLFVNPHSMFSCFENEQAQQLGNHHHN